MKLELQTNILGNFELLPNVALSILSPKCNCVFKGSDLAEDSYIMYAALPRDTADVTLCILLKWGNHLRQSLTWQSIKTQKKKRGKKNKQNLGPTFWDSETFSNSEALFWVKKYEININNYECWNSTLTTADIHSFLQRKRYFWKRLFFKIYFVEV